MRPTERAVVLVLRGHAGDVEFGAIPQLYNAVRLPHRATDHRLQRLSAQRTSTFLFSSSSASIQNEIAMSSSVREWSSSSSEVLRVIGLHLTARTI